MDVLYAVCCGLDVHKASVTACLRSPGAGTQRRQEVRTFGTTTRELLRLEDWLTTAGCTHVAMESTGVYWRPVYNLLEGPFELLLVNAQHVKMVPGRKTDVRDSEWLAQLLELGLLRRSFVPPATQRELRDVVRYRKRLIEDRAREANRVQKVLETANIKLASVVTDVLGVSARAMLKALIAGTGTPAELAELAQRRMRRKRAALGEALTGRVTAHHRFMLENLLRHIEFLDEAIATSDRHIERLTAPQAAALARLDTIPGVARRTAEVIAAELGCDMTRFPTAGHAASWAGPRDSVRGCGSHGQCRDRGL
jgi:transposase